MFSSESMDGKHILLGNGMFDVKYEMSAELRLLEVQFVSRFLCHSNFCLFLLKSKIPPCEYFK